MPRFVITFTNQNLSNTTFVLLILYIYVYDVMINFIIYQILILQHYLRSTKPAKSHVTLMPRASKLMICNALCIDRMVYNARALNTLIIRRWRTRNTP